MTQKDHLRLVRNAAFKLLTRCSRRAHIPQIIALLHWLPIKVKI
uniref:Uncharacterized protein n=1 Tax=Anguilla anguilla TaxID=7936 RepID=A0A0E9XEM9_ANGAN